MPKTSKRAIQAPPTDSLDYGRKRSQWRDVLHRLTRNKLAMLGLVIVLVLVLAAVFADFVAPYDPDVQDYTNMKAYPSFAHPLGTDDVGRDTLTVAIFGDRSKTRALTDLLADFGILEIAKTGTLAIERGRSTIYDDNKLKEEYNYGKNVL